MDNLVADFIINYNEPLEAEFELRDSYTFDCSFELFASGTVWGSIDGDITNQTDLQNALNLKADKTDLDADVEIINQTINENYNDLNGKISVNTGNITSIQNTINSYGDIVTYDAVNFATASQGALADTALQSGDNITELVNNAGYITSADLPTLEDLTTQAQMNAINSGATSVNIAQIASNTQAISTETENRQNADNGLQSQIDAIVASSDVFDIVGTYAELQAYDISTVPPNDIIKVLVDSTHNNAATYYRCVETGGVKSWDYIGSEGAYYTKSEADGRFVPLERTINGKALSNNITLDATDVGALPSSTVIPVVDQTYDGTSTNAQSGVAINGAKFLQNTATGNSSITVNGTATAKSQAINIGTGSQATGNYGTALGAYSFGNASHAVGIGNYAKATADYAIQLNKGTNSTSNSLYVGFNSDNYQLLDGTTGLIPDARISSNIARASDVTTALNGKQDVLTAGTDLEIVEGGALVPLPEGYTQIEYITTDGTAYIDTGITVAETDTLDISFTDTSTPTTAMFITGRNGSDGQTMYFVSPSSSLIQWKGRPTGVTLAKGLEYNIVLKSGEVTYTNVYGTTTKTFTGGAISDTGTCLIGAGRSGATTIDSRKFIGNISKWQIKDSNNDLRFNGIPCYNSNNVYGLYDVIGNNFFPSIGTSDFTGGNEVVAGTVINFTNTTGYITGINSTDVTTALGYTPYDGTTNSNKYISNIANGTGSLTILGTATNGNYAVNIGSSTSVAGYSVSIGNGTVGTGGYSVAIGNSASSTGTSAVTVGRGAKASGTSGVAIGRDASASGNYAIQLGKGTNSTAYTLSAGFDSNNYQLLDGTTGLIPDARLSSNIARTSAIPTVNNATLTIQKNGTDVQTFTANASSNVTCNITVPTDTSDLTNNAGYITGITSGDVITALGYTPYNSTNPNGYTSNIGTVTSVNNTQPDANGNVTISTGGTVDQTYDGTSANAQSGVAIAGAGFLTSSALSGYVQNTATGTNSLTIMGNANNYNNSINIGNNSSSFDSGVAIGDYARVTYNYGTAIGKSALAGGTGTVTTAIGYMAEAINASNCIQIGQGTNSTSNSLSIGFGTTGNYQLLDGSTGLIPDARLSSNIARTSQIPTVPTTVSSFTNDAGYITGITSTDVTTALGYTPLNTDASNLSSTGQKVFDGQWVDSYSSVFSDTSLTASTNLNKTVTLPNDGSIYMVTFRAVLTCGNATGNYIRLSIKSNVIDNPVYVCSASTRANASITQIGWVTIPVEYGSNNITITRASGYTGTATLEMLGYRRVGTNT